jgi:DEAD/DEAH box helicase domain-containing protein
MDGKHVTVVTSTASGKSLCYNAPVLHTLLSNPRKKALYLFPTKALAQDQFRKLRALDLQRPRIGIYDGDTLQAERRRVRRNCDVVISNPDMLHVGMLPCHTNWAEFFSNLAFVVVDEMHAYRGVFGAHVANIMRRLRRICRHYGCAPQFISASATIANPAELMRRLTGVQADLIDSDGSPSGEKWIVFWNPPYVGGGQRKSANSEAALLLVELVRHGIRSVTFAKARVVAELIYRYAVEALADAPELSKKIMSYRGGYSPQQRRDIERGMFSGALMGVTATSALELGIDIGGLDACVMAGYPGSIASTWQRAGRAGRGLDSSLAVLVAAGNPLDQFLMRNPEYLLDATHERVIVDPDNPYVVAEHLMCAAYELPLTELDYPLFGPDSRSVLDAVISSGNVVEKAGKCFWSAAGYPAASTSIRSAGGDSFDICDSASADSVMGTVEEARVLHVLHEGAVYLHQGDSYIVDRLDMNLRRAYVSRRDVDYYTVPRTLSDIRIESCHESRPFHSGAAHVGDVVVTSQVIGYWRRALLSDANLETVELQLPSRSYETTAVWLTFSTEMPESVLLRNQGLEGGLHAIEHALIGMMPLYVMCDPSDVGGASHPVQPGLGVPTIFVYDGYPGGVGIAKSLYDELERALAITLEGIESCECSNGCPSCIQSPKCGNNNTPLDKKSAVAILKQILV